jgi:hypothetical protein
MGYNCLFTDIGVTVFRRSDDSVAFKGVLEGQLYLVDFDRAELGTCLIAKTNMGWLWHRRLAHVGMKNLHKLLKGEHILGLLSGPVSHGYSVAERGCLLQAATHSALLGHWGLTAAGLPSSDIASPNGLALHNGNMLCFHPELVLLDCSAGLLGQEDDVPADSASRTDLLLTNCSGDSDASAEDTAFETAAAEVGAGSA